jgi:hypothetical protein
MTMKKLSEYETFKQLCKDSVFKSIKRSEYGLGDGEIPAHIVTLDDGHLIVISLEAFAFSESANDSVTAGI